MNKTFAWAVIEDDKAAVIDYRVPVFWLRKFAKQFNQERCIDGRVARVEIKEVPRKRRKA